MPICPLCRRRPARRECQALQQRICPVCCATKRQIEVRCPPDCRHLENAQLHPPAAVKRQHDRDVAALLSTMGRPAERQLQLFFLVASALARHKPDAFSTLSDVDIVSAAGALATTLETASRGVIYEQQPASAAAAALGREVKALLDEVGRGGGSRFEREAAEVLRGIERGARHESPLIGDGPTAYCALIGRIAAEAPRTGSPRPPSLITP